MIVHSKEETARQQDQMRIANQKGIFVVVVSPTMSTLVVVLNDNCELHTSAPRYKNRNFRNAQHCTIKHDEMDAKMPYAHGLIMMSLRLKEILRGRQKTTFRINSVWGHLQYQT